MKIYQIYLDSAYYDPDDNLCFSRGEEIFFKNKNDAIEYLHNLTETTYLPDTELEAPEEPEKIRNFDEVATEYLIEHNIATAEEIEDAYLSSWKSATDILLEKTGMCLFSGKNLCEELMSFYQLSVEYKAKWEEVYKHDDTLTFIDYFKESGGIEMGIIPWGELYIVKEIEVK